MKMTPLQLSVFALSISLLAQSCAGPTYAQDVPAPPPVYSQPPPPTTDVSITISSGQPAPEQAPPPLNYQSFYDELSPYGQWITTPQYGYVWVPAAGTDFQPYATYGHWVLTNYGWTWASDYPWGWAAFHYGTWEFDAFMGWFWIPGYQWSPAWVSWRSCNGYYGWAPLGPGYASVGYANYNCPPERYVFINATYMNNPNMGRYYEPRGQNATYFNRSSVVTNTYVDRGNNSTYYAGPQSTEVERYTGAPMRPVNLVQTTSPERDGSSGNEMRMFRPSVQQPGNNAASRPAPTQVYQQNQIKPVQQRQTLTQPNQPRVAPFNSGNSQHGAGQSNPQQSPSEQHTTVQQQAPAQEQQQHPAMQQPPTQQQQTPAQESTQKSAAQEQQHPAIQQPPTQQQQTPTQESLQKSSVQEQQHPVQQQAPAQEQQHSVMQQPPTQQQQAPAQQHPAVQQSPAQQQHPIQQSPAQQHSAPPQQHAAPAQQHSAPRQPQPQKPKPQTKQQGQQQGQQAPQR